jgi:hypothetical protein
MGFSFSKYYIGRSTGENALSIIIVPTLGLLDPISLDVPLLQGFQTREEPVYKSRPLSRW